MYENVLKKNSTFYNNFDTQDAKKHRAHNSEVYYLFYIENRNSNIPQINIDNNHIKNISHVYGA